MVEDGNIQGGHGRATPLASFGWHPDGIGKLKNVDRILIPPSLRRILTGTQRPPSPDSALRRLLRSA